MTLDPAARASAEDALLSPYLQHAVSSQSGAVLETVSAVAAASIAPPLVALVVCSSSEDIDKDEDCTLTSGSVSVA